MKIDGYAPDLDPATPGVLVNCSNFIPGLKGMEGAPSAQSLSVDALAAACQGAAVLTDLDDTRRVFAGTGTKLYELSGTSWTDRTRASGGNYALGADIRWSFSQFGNIGLAVAKTDTLQYSDTGAFANVTGAPKATIVETVGQFVFLFDTNEATYNDSPNRWWCCAKGDYTNWTPSIPNECATGILTSAPGAIKAGRRFGDNIIAYKEKSMFLGVYVGTPAIWDFREIPGRVGALGQSVVVDVGAPENPMHIFMGNSDFYKFDGSRPVPIGSPVRETVFGQINRAYIHLCSSLHDISKGRVYFFYPSTNSTTLDKCVVYNYKTGRWGRDDREIEAVIDYVTPGLTYAALGNSFSTYNDLPSVTYDSSFWTSGTAVPAVFDTAHTLKTLNGDSLTSSFTTGDFGSDSVMTSLSRVTPRWITKPTSASLVNYYKMSSGDSLVTDQTTPMDSRFRFDVMREAAWHRLSVSNVGPVVLSEMLVEVVEGGGE